MSVDTIRDLSDRLERHQAAFYKGGGFESFSDRKLLFYLGYGRELVLPDGRSYEAYIKGGESTLRIKFIGPRLRTPRLKTELGYIQLVAQDDGLTLSGATHGREKGRADLHAHDFPEVTELVKPFGSWAADGLARELNREKANARITGELWDKFWELQQSVLTAGEIDELTLVEQSTAKLTQIIRNFRKVEAPYTVVPSAEEVAFLEEFIDNPANTTAGYVPVVEKSAVGIQVIHAPGPLLS